MLAIADRVARNSVALFVCLAGPLMATASQPGDVSLAFRDSVTGVTVTPASIVVDGEEYSSRMGAKGTVCLLLSAGDHSLSVSAWGYQDMRARLTPSPDGPLNHVVWLDPLAPPAEASTDALQLLAGHSEDRIAGLAGYIVDDLKGKPLPGVHIELSGLELATETDDRGFFSLSVPLAGGQPVPGNEAELCGLFGLTATRDGYGAYQRTNLFLATANTVLVRIRLRADEVVEDERGMLGRLPLLLLHDIKVAYLDEPPASAVPPAAESELAPREQTAPTSVRLGRSCSCRTCTEVEIISMETYVKRVLPAEWYASWHSNSLKAGAIAIRSYSGWYTYNPLSFYDICDNSCCQNYGTNTYTATNTAVDATAGIYLASSTRTIGRAEYSAENNNSPGCGDCYIENKPSDGVCLHDSVCCGATFNGHGRGLCQWGSQRWANTQGKDYTWILDHYYSAYGWTIQDLTQPAIPDAPTGVTASDGTYLDRVAVAWNASTGATGYQVWRATTNNSGSASQLAAPTVTSYDDTTAVSGTTYYYWVKATNSSGSSGFSISDSGYRATAVQAPTITEHPSSQTVCPATSATFSVTATTGAGTLSYQWQKDGSDLANDGHYSGVTTATLTVSDTQASDIGNYRCMVTNSAGSATSNQAALALRAVTAITQHPAGQRVCLGNTAQFTVAGTGSGTLSYQWQQNSVNLSNGGRFSGVTTAALTISDVSTSEITSYRCVVTALCGSATSATANLTLRAATRVTQQPASASVTRGTTVQFSIMAAGENTISYQWQKDGANLANGGRFSGVTAATLTIADVRSTDAGQYVCVATAECGTVPSEAATLTVAGPPPIPGDLDDDSDVDLSDYGLFQLCLGGSGQVIGDPDCLAADLDNDQDVDATDSSIFRQCFSGTNIDGDPLCTGL
ncbi:MAG: hypothetical protein GXY55_13630 [Phycisphaerae bacterium]|nr:hypothetical protein [Phycisphaerae bacterium]